MVSCTPSFLPSSQPWCGTPTHTTTAKKNKPPTLTQTQMLMAQQIKMITGEELADDFYVSYSVGRLLRNFLPGTPLCRVRFSGPITIWLWGWWVWTSSCHIDPKIDREHADIYHFSGYQCKWPLFRPKKCRIKQTKPHFRGMKMGLQPPISYVEYSQRDTSKEIPNVFVVHAPQLGTMNYKMILGKHACIVTAEEYETIKTSFLILILTHVSLEVYFSARLIVVSIPKRRNPLCLSVFIRQKMEKIQQALTTFLYAHIREALKQVWDEETKVIFLKE